MEWVGVVRGAAQRERTPLPQKGQRSAGSGPTAHRPPPRRRSEGGGGGRVPPGSHSPLTDGGQRAALPRPGVHLMSGKGAAAKTALFFALLPSEMPRIIGISYSISDVTLSLGTRLSDVRTAGAKPAVFSFCDPLCPRCPHAASVSVSLCAQSASVRQVPPCRSEGEVVDRPGGGVNPTVTQWGAPTGQGRRASTRKGRQLRGGTNPAITRR